MQSPENQDLLYGVPAIAEFLNLKPAAVYHLAAKGTLPTFKIGAKVCARRSTLTAWLADQEAASAKGGARG
ncbi:helix-turn-helix transcriptional regulator [Xanthobacter sediminis]